MSPPTYAPNAGNRNARARGWAWHVQVGREHFRQLPRGHDERGHAERLRVDAERDVRHRGVASDRDLGNIGRIGLRLRAHLSSQLPQGFPGERAQRAQRAGIEHRCADPGDHVGAERLLLVQHRRHCERRPGTEVEQRRDDCCGAEVEGDAEQLPGRVASLHVDEHVVDDDRGDLEVGRAQPAAEVAQHGEIYPQFQVVQRCQHPLDVGLLIS